VRILLALDGSPQAARGIELVRRLALTPSDEVIVASVAEASYGLAVGLAGPPMALAWYDAVREAVREHANQVVADGSAALAGHGRIRTIVREGHPVEELRAIATELAVDLIVVGPHGRGRLESILVGSTSQGLLDGAHTSVLIARSLRNGLRTVVLAVDGSAHSAEAVRFLAALPLPEESRIVATTVIPARDPGYGRAWSDAFLATIEADERRAGQRVLDDAAAAVRRAGREATTDLRAGMPKHAILEAVEEHGADLVVLGARGLGGFEQLVLGSVSRGVSKAAPCSALVVHLT
jgi:nucleotide-binding universal stress UspA family protein